MFTPTSDRARSLGNNLVLKAITTDHDIDRLAAFNTHIHGDQLTPMTQGLIRHHPHTRPEHWLFIEEESTQQIIASLCLIPWLWRYEQVELQVGEMGIVGTLAAYRNRGLIRALVSRFKELLQEGQYDLSIIQGIPYFYRQFGYEYALPLEAGWRLELHNIPPAPEGVPSFGFRAATLADLPLLMRLYQESVEHLAISTVRDADSWKYLLTQVLQTANVHETWIVEDQTGQIVGYFATDGLGFGQGLIVSEGSQLTVPASSAVLRELKRMALERGKPDLRLNLPHNHPLLAVARGWNAHDHGTYAWQIHLPDVARLLRTLSPVLESRIASSPFAGLTQAVTLNLYREAFKLNWQGGKLTEVEPLGFSDQGAISMPPLLLAPLILGYRSLDELRHFAPDVGAWGESQYLVEVLFPRMSSFIYTQY